MQQNDSLVRGYGPDQPSSALNSHIVLLIRVPQPLSMMSTHSIAKSVTIWQSTSGR